MFLVFYFWFFVFKMLLKFSKYPKIWLKTSSLSLQSQLTSKGASLMYIAGKLIRFGFFLWLIVRVAQNVQRISGYHLNQLVIFFLVFNLFDMLGQILFRGIYWFRADVVSGRFDLVLLKPINVLFQVLTRHTDFLDLPLFTIVLFALLKQGIYLKPLDWLLFFIIGAASLLIITAVHIFVASIGVLTTEIDHTIMIYRDLSNMARVPVDIYAKPIRLFLTFAFPVAIVMTFPAKAVMGILTFPWISFSLAVAFLFFFFSLKLWQYALTQYSSASS